MFVAEADLDKKDPTPTTQSQRGSISDTSWGSMHGKGAMPQVYIHQGGMARSRSPHLPAGEARKKQGSRFTIYSQFSLSANASEMTDQLQEAPSRRRLASAGIRTFHTFLMRS